MTSRSNRADRRQASRYRVRKPCLIRFSALTDPLSCIAVDLSAEGAGLVCDGQPPVMTKNAEIIFLAEQLSQPVRLIWSEDHLAGFAFAGAASHLPPSADTAGCAAETLPDLKLFDPKD